MPSAHHRYGRQADQQKECHGWESRWPLHESRKQADGTRRTQFLLQQQSRKENLETRLETCWQWHAPASRKHSVLLLLSQQRSLDLFLPQTQDRMRRALVWLPLLCCSVFSWSPMVFCLSCRRWSPIFAPVDLSSAQPFCFRNSGPIFRLRRSYSFATQFLKTGDGCTTT